MKIWKIKRRIYQLYILFKYITIWLFVKMFEKKLIQNSKYKNLWIVSERGNDARDNGYVFFKYLKENHKDINTRYIINSKSVDYKKIAQYGETIEYGSIEHYIAIILAKVLISTHIMGYTPQMNLFMYLDKVKKLKLKGKKVFLQHGIIKDKMNLKSSLDLFVSGAEREYSFLIETYPQYRSSIKNTGLARYDFLKQEECKKQILIMPTWRLYLSDCKDITPYDYFRCYNDLLNDDNIIELLDKNGYELLFYPHYEMQKFLGKYNTKRPDIIKIAKFEDYDVQRLLIESSILITDFSSVFFDFAYMRKPIIYYQFDEEKYRETQYQEGYFDYRRDGFGRLVKQREELIVELDKILKNNSCIQDVYKRRIDGFFGNKSIVKNCDKIYNEIIKLFYN